MYMRRATPDRFRRYTIVAENSVGIGRRDVELVQSEYIRKEIVEAEIEDYDAGR
jgi:hypothetical protein